MTETERGQIQTGKALPHIEIIRAGQVIYQSLADVPQITALRRQAANEAQAIADAIDAIDRQVDALRAVPATDRLETTSATIARLQGERDYFEAQLAALPTELDRDTSRFVDLRAVSYSFDGRKKVKRSAQMTLGGARQLIDRGLGTGVDPFTDVFVRLFWDTSRTSMADPLAFPQRDATVIDGELEVGVYRVDSIGFAVERDGSTTIDITGRDSLQQFADVATDENFSIPAGSRACNEIRKLILLQDPDAEVVVTPSAGTIGPLSWEQGTSYLAIITDLAQAASHQVRVDTAGRYHCEPAPEPANATDLTSSAPTYSAGDGQVVDAARNVSRNGIINGVVVRGENLNSANDPVEASVWLSEGPYAYDPDGEQTGGIGPMPLVIVDRTIDTEEDALALARSTLRREAGLQDTVTVQLLADPSLRDGDLINLSIPEIGAQGAYTVETIDFGQNADGDQTMSITARQRRVAEE